MAPIIGHIAWLQAKGNAETMGLPVIIHLNTTNGTMIKAKNANIPHSSFGINQTSLLLASIYVNREKKSVTATLYSAHRRRLEDL